MRRFLSASLRFLLLAIALAALPVRAASAQIGVSFTPSSGSWLAGTQVGVTIKFCANPEQWYLSGKLPRFGDIGRWYSGLLAGLVRNVSGCARAESGDLPGSDR